MEASQNPTVEVKSNEKKRKVSCSLCPLPKKAQDYIEKKYNKVKMVVETK